MRAGYKELKRKLDASEEAPSLVDDTVRGPWRGGGGSLTPRNCSPAQTAKLKEVKREIKELQKAEANCQGEGVAAQIEKLERAAQDANAEIDSRVRAFEENLNDDDISSDQ